MRLILFSICILVSFLGLAQRSVEQTLRDEILNNEFDSKQILKFYELVHGIENPSSIAKAYKAVAEAFMARVEWNPYGKFVYLRKSHEMFEELVIEEPESLEVRFLRFSTQSGIPEFLGFSRDMAKDKDFIIMKLEQMEEHEIDDTLFNFMVDFVSKSKHCTSTDLAMLEKSKKKRFG